MGILLKEHQPASMISLIVLGLAACVSGSLVTYPNGAQVPYDGANLAATHAHLASKGYYHGGPAYGGLVHHGGVHYLGKREAEADASYLYPAPLAYGYPVVHHVGVPLVGHPNGAVVPAEPLSVVQARADHLAAKAALG